MVAAQAAGRLGERAFLRQSALDVLKVALALAGLALGGVDAPVRRAVVQPRGGDVDVDLDLMTEAEVLVDVGRGDLARGDSADGRGGTGDTVAAGEEVSLSPT